MNIKQFKQESHIDGDLITAVIEQLGGVEAFRESVDDITNHGIDGGFRGFIYNTDTHAFYRRNQASIAALVEQLANDLGEDVIALVRSFKCASDATTSEIGKTLYGHDHDDMVANCLAWFAAEEVCRSWCDLESDDE